jgi:hypothetical protein
MAHFAQLDQNNIVTNVIVVHNNELIDENGNESEQKGIAFCQSIYGANTKWIQTSYNGNFRFRFAGIGNLYDLDRDMFRNPNPPVNNPSFVLDNNGDWIPPIPYPSDGVVNNEEPEKTKRYVWNEETVSWTLITYVDPFDTALENTQWQ